MLGENSDRKIVSKDETWESSKKKKIIELDESSGHAENSESEGSASIHYGSSKKLFRPPVPHSICPLKQDVNKSLSKVCFSKGTSEIKNSNFLIEVTACTMSPKRVLKSAKEHQSTPFSKVKGGSDKDLNDLSDSKANEHLGSHKQIKSLPIETINTHNASPKIILIDDNFTKSPSESMKESNEVPQLEKHRKESIASLVFTDDNICSKESNAQPTSPQKTKCSDNDLSENKTKAFSIKSSKASCFKKSIDKSSGSPEKKDLNESEIKQHLHSKCFEDAEFIKYQTMFDDSTIDILTENNTKMNSLPSNKNEAAIEIEFDDNDLYN